MEGFNSAIEDCQLSKLNLYGGNFMWEKGRGANAWVREKLDRAFATMTWWLRFPLCNLKVSHTSCSDHEPLPLELFYTDISWKALRFRFKNIWLKEPSFVKEVTAVWEVPNVHLLPKLIDVTSFMARWGRSFCHKYREKIKKHKTVLASLVDWTDEQSVKEYLEDRVKLNTLLLLEETYRKQRAKFFGYPRGMKTRGSFI